MSANRVEKLVYWYLRFNGYLTVANFTVHPDYKKDPETEADFLAVRFPFSKEKPLDCSFERDEKLITNEIIDFVIGEAKSSKCDINENSWGNPQLPHIQYALEWMGFTDDNDKINEISQEIHENGAWSDDKYLVRFVAFGREHNPDLVKKYPKITQIYHLHMVEFIFNRLTTYCNALHRENWDEFILKYVDLIEENKAAPNLLLQWTLEKEQTK